MSKLFTQIRPPFSCFIRSTNIFAILTCFFFNYCGVYICHDFSFANIQCQIFIYSIIYSVFVDQIEFKVFVFCLVFGYCI